MTQEKILQKVENKRRLTALVILSERMTLACWRAGVWLLFFCGLWMFQIPVIFGQIAEVIVAAACLLGIVYFIYKDMRNLRWPGEEDIDRRLEKDNQVKHRPLSGLKDDLANPQKPTTRDLWIARKLQLFGILPKLKRVKPKALMASRDPYALRLGVLMFFILGLLVSGPAWNERIWNGLTPISLTDQQRLERGINLWITPPDYTGFGQIVLQGSGQEILKIPDGSTLKLRVHGGLGKPVLYINDQKYALEYGGEDNHVLEMEMPPGQSMKIRQSFMTRAEWAYDLLPDKAPVMVMKGEPEPLPEGPLRFPMMLYDDYGVKTLSMNMLLDVELIQVAPLGRSAEEKRSVMSPAKEEFEMAPVYDLTAHHWAGLPVVFSFMAEDHLGQRAHIDSIKLVLPERPFQHPIAKKLIKIRKKLIWEPDTEYTEIVRALEVILHSPKAYQDDFVVFLALRTASARLFYNEPSKETAHAVIALLWDTALRIEDGNLTLAARQLRDAQQNLEQALQNPDTTEDEISELMHELRQALAEYLLELQKEMQKRMAEGEEMPMIPPEMLSQTIDPDALANFLDQMEALLREGDTQSAQQMLSQLQRMMDMLDPSITAPLPFDMQMMSEGVNELQELIDRQEELLEQTQNQVEILNVLKGFHRHYGEALPRNEELFEDWGLENMPPPPQTKDTPQQSMVINTQKNKVEQEALRYILGQLMIEADEALGGIPENMGLAEREMLGSSEDLDINDPVASVPHQEQAIAYLKQAQEDLTQQFMARMQQMTGMAFSGGRMRYDPLGRPYAEDGGSDLFPGSRVEIPDEAEKKRAQEILRLLRRRAGEFDRPDAELEYYRRLLRQF